MKKLLLLLLCILTLTSCSVSENNNSDEENNNIVDPVNPPVETKEEILNKYIDSLMNNTTSYIPSWNQEGFKGRWNYIDGVFLKSIVDLYNKTNDTKYISFVKKYVDYYIDSNGNFLNLKSDVNQDGYNNKELDSVCESKILFDLYNYTNDNKYKNAIEYTYNELMNNQPRLPDGICFAHKVSYPDQVWLDGFYMYAPFLSRYAKELATNKDEIFDLLYNQYKFVRNHMFDENKKLYYHGYSASQIFWANQNNCSKSFWLRSMGWFLASLPDTLEYYPEGEKKEELKSLYIEALDGILSYLDTDYNMFYQVIDKKGESSLVSYNKYLKYLNNTYTKDTTISNYLESSGSALVSYSLLKGYNLNLLAKSYYDTGKNIFDGIYNKSFSDNKLNDICITAGLGPSDKTYRDGTFEYYLAEKVGSNDAKGVGPFIMAYIEIE